MTKKRVKSDKKLPPIRDWAEADRYVRCIGEFQQNITTAEQKAKQQIDVIKSNLADEVAPCHAVIKATAESIEHFAESHKTDFGSQKSRKLNFGLVGWRKSTFIKIKKTTLSLIKELFTGAKAKMCIHTKETVNKEALAKLTDEQLASVSARREEKDVFFVEPDLTRAADYS